MIAAAVICFVTEASRKRVRGSIGVRVRRSRTPYPRWRTVRPSLRTSTARPGWPSATSPFRSADVAASRSTAGVEPAAKRRRARASTAHDLILPREPEKSGGTISPPAASQGHALGRRPPRGSQPAQESRLHGRGRPHHRAEPGGQRRDIQLPGWGAAQAPPLSRARTAGAALGEAARRHAQRHLGAELPGLAEAGDVLHRHGRADRQDRDHVVRRGRAPPAPAEPGERALLRGPRRAPGPGAPLRPGRGSARQRPRDRAQPAGLAIGVRRGSRPGGPRGRPGWRAAHRRGRAPGGRVRPARERRLHAARLPPRRRAQLPLHERDRAAQARGQPRAGAGGDEPHRRRHRRAVSRDQEGLGGHRRPPAGPRGGPSAPDVARRPDGRGGGGAAHRLRQPREPPAGPGHRAHARDQHQDRPGRGPLAPRPPAPHGEPAPLLRRWPRRPRPGGGAVPRHPLAAPALLTILTTVLFGLAPALHASRCDPIEALKEGGRSGSVGRRKARLRNGLVVAQVALAFVLVSGAGLLIRSFARLTSVDAGFDATNVVTMGFLLQMEKDTDGDRLTGYLGEAIEAVRAVPGVQEVALTSALPLQGWGFGMPFRIEGRATEPSRRPACYFKIVTPGYFRALGMKLRKGRGLSEADAQGAAPVLVANETFVRRFLSTKDPIGQHVMIERIVTGKRELGPEVPWEVVGVVADEKVSSLDDTSAGVYVSYAQSPIVGVSLLARGVGDPQALIASIRRAIWAVNKNQALPNPRTLEEIKSDSLGQNRLRTILIAAFAGLALSMAALGVYGVLSYVTAQRTLELGVRAALGASATDLVRLVVRAGSTSVLLGLIIGGYGAVGLTRWLREILFEVDPTDPATMAVTAGVLILVGWAACYVPARRAACVDPMTALRTE